MSFSLPLAKNTAHRLTMMRYTVPTVVEAVPCHGPHDQIPLSGQMGTLTASWSNG
jgi:hypothetical protein